LPARTTWPGASARLLRRAGWPLRAATASGALALRRAGRPLPEHPRAADLFLIGVVSYKISRLLAKDKVTSFLRAPFTRFQEASGQGEMEEEACGHGIRYAVGELLICPLLSLAMGRDGADARRARLAAPHAPAVRHVLRPHGPGFLQLAYRAAEDAV
jgi:hypothetical protein